MKSVNVGFIVDKLVLFLRVLQFPLPILIAPIVPFLSSISGADIMVYLRPKQSHRALRTKEKKNKQIRLARTKKS
jgi:hypothetical protein